MSAAVFTCPDKADLRPRRSQPRHKARRSVTSSSASIVRSASMSPALFSAPMTDAIRSSAFSSTCSALIGLSGVPSTVRVRCRSVRPSCSNERPIRSKRMSAALARRTFSLAANLRPPGSLLRSDYNTREPVRSFQSVQIPCTQQSNGVQIRAIQSILVCAIHESICLI